MLVVTRPPINPYGHTLDEQVGLHCSRCGKPFRSLEEAFLTYQAPPVGGQADTSWVHRTCSAGEAKVKLVRGDWALRRLLESLLTPPITKALRKDLPGARRPWGSP